MKFFIFICISLFVHSSLQSLLQTCYPLAFDDNNNKIYFVMQEGTDTIELWQKNITTNVIKKLLMNAYKPVGFSLLPSRNGFSFIHNDAVYVKKFQKRSPRRIEFLEPIYGINTIIWEADEVFYFAAYFRKKYALFKSDLEGAVECVVSYTQADCLWPCILNKTIFFLKREDNLVTHLVALDGANEKIILSFAERIPTSFLSMVNDKEGYCVQYEPYFSQEIACKCLHFFKRDDIWIIESLFSFSLPIKYFVEGEHRFFESIMPFLPCYTHNYIYYCSLNAMGTISIFSYEIATRITKEIMFSNENISFIAPLYVKNKLCCGFIKE